MLPELRSVRIVLLLQVLAFAAAQDCAGQNQVCIPIRQCGPIVKQLIKARNESDKSKRKEIIAAVSEQTCGANKDRLICCSGEPLGSFTNIFHQIGGIVYALDETKIAIKNFHYDGQGPDAFFLAGTTGKKPNPSSPDQNTVVLPYSNNKEELREAYEYRDSDIPILGEFDGTRDLLIKLPPKTSASDIRWISVWCRDYKINFGHAYLQP